MLFETEVSELKNILDELVYLLIEIAAYYEHQMLVLEASLSNITPEHSA